MEFGKMIRIDKGDEESTFGFQVADGRRCRILPGCFFVFPVILLAFAGGCTVDFSPGGARCGNGVIEGDNLGGETCESLGGTSGSGLSCSADCTFDVSGCLGMCGNNYAEEGEACDGTDVRGETFVSLGFDGGILGCSADCTFDFSGCFTCGNGVCDHQHGENPSNCSQDCGFVTMISAGEYHSCAVMNYGAAWCWGNNFAGVLGDGTDEDRHTPVQVVWQ